MRFLGDDERIRRMSIIEETGERYVRMAHLACVGSHAINGVAELHTELLKRDVLKDFNELWPGKFSNKTNGVTPRRWMALSNPRLSSLITEQIGDGWIRDLAQLERLERWRRIPPFALAGEKSSTRTSATSPPWPRSARDSDRSELHVRCPGEAHSRVQTPAFEGSAHRLDVSRHQVESGARHRGRTFIFGGKAAPGYHLAKLMIKLITAVGDVINRDPDVRDRLRVLFLPTSTSPTANASIRPPTFRNRSRPPARKPQAPAT